MRFFSRRLRLPIVAITLASLLAAPATPAASAGAPQIAGFTLIDADTDMPIPGFDPIPQDATLNLATLPNRRLNMRANPVTEVGSVRLKKDGGTARIDNAGPYALVGDTNGDFAPWTPATGRHTAYATGFTQAGGRGTPSATVALSFRVVDTNGSSSPPSAAPSPGASAPAATPSLRPAPTPPPAVPNGEPGNGNGPSQCGPIPAAPAGWQREVSSTFSETTRLGSWPGPIAGRDWRSRLAGYRDSSGRGIYNSAKTVSEHDGLLDIWIHSEGGQRYVAAPIPKLGDTFGQRISVCMRADRIPGYKLAFLLWPDEGPGNHHGEINFPEGKLTPTGEAFGFMHYDPKPSSGKQQDAYNTRTSSVDWHRYTLEWDPGAAGSQSDDYVAFYLDGRLVGRSQGANVPDGPMHYIMQIETYIAGQELPAPAEGHVQLDWVTIDVPT